MFGKHLNTYPVPCYFRRPGDLFLQVNNCHLENKRQKKVRKIFRKIKPDKLDGRIHMKLVFQRWETRKHNDVDSTFEVVYQLLLVLEPIRKPDPESVPQPSSSGRTHQQKYSFRVSSKVQNERGETLLPKGEIDNIESGNEEISHIKALYVEVDEYLTVGHDGLCSLEVPCQANRSKNTFTLSFFSGRDRSSEPLSMFIYCVRISSFGSLGTTYLTTDLKSHNELSFRESNTVRVREPSDIDESCFIVRYLGNETLFESLLHRGYYIGCYKTTDEKEKLQMFKHEFSEVKDLGALKFEICRPDLQRQEERGFLDIFRSVFSCTRTRTLNTV